MNNAIGFSLFLPQAGAPYAVLRDKARLLETLKYDGIWLVDHMFANGAEDMDFPEGWATLAGLAEATSSLRLGLLVTCNSYRNPALLAKIAATVDCMSDGRLELGIGAGWMEEEYRAYGWDFPSVAERLGRLDEALQIITSMFASSRTSFEGKYYRVENAPLAPKPLQCPLPITIGGAGEKVLLRLVAKYAQRWNCPMTNAADLPRLRSVLEAHCGRLGREVEEIVVSEQLPVIIGRDDDQLKEKLDLAKMMIGSFVDIETMAVLGTPDSVADQLGRKIDTGVRDFALLFGDFGSPETLELFADKVMPALRSA
ncbi:MAG: TIGR03560 family F420-dependent LLM class oxidoreductase [Candidatus Binatia bacterium]